MGHGADQRNDALARQCAKLAAQGWTHRNIAETVGKRPEQIKNLILKGERLAQYQVAHESQPHSRKEE